MTALFQSVRQAQRFLLAAILLAVSAAPALAQSTPSMVDPAWLIQNLEAPNLVVLDLRRTNAFRTGHLPGSVNIDPATMPFRVAVPGGANRMPEPGEFAQRMGSLGIGEKDRLILISRGESWLDVATATDLFWLLKRFGHAQVAILNGGYRRLAELGGFTAAKEASPRAPTTYRPAPSLVRPATPASLTSGGATLVDARLRGQYLGINKAAIVSRRATVPGARNLPANWVTLDAGGRIRRPDTLLPLLALAGVPENGPVVVFGNTSLAGSLVWFVLRVVLGNQEARLLEGGIADWLNDPSNEVSVPYTSGVPQQP